MIFMRILTSAYVMGLFLLSCKGRQILNFLKERGFFKEFILTVFVLTFVFGLIYVFKKGFSLRGVSWLRLSFGALMLYGALSHCSYPEEKIHLVEFGLLSLLFLHSVEDEWPWKKKYLWAFILGATIGFGDELLQWFLPTRFFDWRDVGLNIFSAFLSLWIFESIFGYLKCVNKDK